MNGCLVNLARNLRRRKRLIGFACAVLTIFGWAGLRLRAQRLQQPAHARQKIKTVRNRAEEICSVLGNTCEIDPRPIFSERSTQCYLGDTTPLRIWKFMCQIDGRPTWLIFNDNTGSMCYLIAERTDLEASVKHGPRSINAQGEAAEAGFQCLKAMKLLPHGALIALHGLPYLNEVHTVWEMTWEVKREPASEPYGIRIVLSRENGALLSLVDTSQLHKLPGL